MASVVGIGIVFEANDIAHLGKQFFLSMLDFSKWASIMVSSRWERTSHRIVLNLEVRNGA